MYSVPKIILGSNIALKICTLSYWLKLKFFNLQHIYDAFYILRELFVDGKKMEVDFASNHLIFTHGDPPDFKSFKANAEVKHEHTAR